MSFIAATQVDHSQAPRNASRRQRLEWQLPESSLVNPAPFLQLLGQKVVVRESRPLLSACNLPGRHRARRRAGAPGGGGGQGTRRPTVAKNLEIVVMTWRGRGRPHCRHIHDRCATPASVGTAPVVRFLALSLVMCSCLASFSAVVLSDEVSARDCRHDTTKPRLSRNDEASAAFAPPFAPLHGVCLRLNSKHAGLPLGHGQYFLE